MHELVATPFSYQALQHDLSAQQEFIRKHRHQPMENWIHEIYTVGEGTITVYEGKEEPQQIVNELQQFLQSNKNFEPEDFKDYINNRDCQFITLRNRTMWQLQPGSTYERYIKIQPARNSALSFRARLVALKLALVWSCKNDDPLLLPDKTTILSLLEELNLSDNTDFDDYSHLHFLLKKLNQQ
jgi:hypothetical protein